MLGSQSNTQILHNVEKVKISQILINLRQVFLPMDHAT